jgi:hypothetical protein
MLFEHLNFLQGLVLLLLTALFFKEEMKPAVARMLGFEKKSSVEDKMDRLVEHYNHETTERLDTLISMEDEERVERQQMREVMRDTRSLLAEFKEYGIRLRT